MSSSVSVSEAIRFLRQNNVLKDWSDSQIHCAISKAVNENALAFTLDYIDCEHKITSLALCSWNNDSSLYIIALAGKNKVKLLLDHLVKNFPNCTKITAERRGKAVEYNVSKLIKHLNIL